MGAFIGALWCEEARYTRFVQRGREWAMVSLISDQFSYFHIIYNFNSLAFYVPHQKERDILLLVQIMNQQQQNHCFRKNSS